MSILITTLLTLTPALPSQDAPAAGAGDASALMDAVQAAFGESGRLAAIRNMRIRGQATWKGLQGQGLFTQTYSGPREARVLTEFQGFGTFQSGLDGTLAWEKSPSGIVVRTGWEAAELARRFARAQHVPWRELYARATFAGEEEIDGRSCARVELAPLPMGFAGAEEGDAPPPDVWYIDTETKLPARIDSRAPGMDGQPTRVRFDYFEWREVGGVLYAHREEVTISSFTLVFRIEKVEHDVKLPEGFFTPDEDVRAFAKERDEGVARDLTEPHVVTLEERHLAAIRVKCKHADMQKTLSVALPEAFTYVTSIGAEMTGQPLVRYHSFGDEVDLEAAIPVKEPVKGEGRVKPAKLPAGLAVETWHVGPYDKLGETHERIAAYMESEGLEARGALWEEYWTDPGLEPDPAKWRTNVLYPVKRKE